MSDYVRVDIKVWNDGTTKFPVVDYTRSLDTTIQVDGRHNVQVEKLVASSGYGPLFEWDTDFYMVIEYPEGEVTREEILIERPNDLFVAPNGRSYCMYIDQFIRAVNEGLEAADITYKPFFRYNLNTKTIDLYWPNDDSLVPIILLDPRIVRFFQGFNLNSSVA